MFTGIIRAVGEIQDRVMHGVDGRLRVTAPGLTQAHLAMGASVAVNGVCLTVVDAGKAWFAADVSAETLRVTALGRLAPGSSVNLEPSLRLGDPLDGHWVTGHIDGVAEVMAVTPVGGGRQLRFRLPAAISRYVARKGSVAVDGTSLTVNAVAAHEFEVMIIPHTLTATIIGTYTAGTAVNIEVDIVARYLERLGTTDSRDSHAD